MLLESVKQTYYYDINIIIKIRVNYAESKSMLTFLKIKNYYKTTFVKQLKWH